MARYEFVLAALAASIVGSSGCGTAASNVFSNGSNAASDDKELNGASFGGDGSGDGGTGTPQVGTVGAVSPSSACATSAAGVVAPPVSLVFMVDRSGSMGNGPTGQNLDLRWNPVRAGLTAFFADAANGNVHASLGFFSDGTTKNLSDLGCLASTYATPKVAMTTLPNATSFAASFNATSPSGGTPTSPALNGALAYAQSAAVQSRLLLGEKVAVVLATDGVPNGCDSSVSKVASVAAAAAASIPTYVIGVGPETGNLDEIAQAGGTTKAIMISTSNTAQVSADLRAAIGQIKAAQLGCNYPLPNPPAGQSLDVNAVNVNYTPGGGGTAQTMSYSGDCAKTNGWHYDSTTAPTRIVMCPSACTTLKNDKTGGKLDIIFGCAIAANPGDTLPGGGVK